jgi:hypothetical protein
MNARLMTVTLPDHAAATLTVPLPLTRQALRGLEQALSAALGSLHRDAGGDTGSEADDAGAIEYASWLRQLRAARP